MSSRDKLVEAMGELMWEHGYTATSPREVREVSGVGQGSMYHYFPTKHDLGLAALQRNCEIHAGICASALESTDDPLEALAAYVTLPRQPLKGCRVGRMAQDRAVTADDELRAPVAQAFAQTHERLLAVIEEAKAAGQLPGELDADRLAHTIAAVFQGAYVLAIAQQDPGPCEAACQGVIDLLHAAAGSAPGGPVNGRELSESLGSPSPVPRPKTLAGGGGHKGADDTTASTESTESIEGES